MDRTAFDDFFDEQMSDPARAEAYREARTEIDTYDRFMRAMNALRESRGVSKATLASKSGIPAQSIRKLLTDKKANPTIATVFKMLSTMGLGCKSCRSRASADAGRPRAVRPLRNDGRCAPPGTKSLLGAAAPSAARRSSDYGLGTRCRAGHAAVHCLPLPAPRELSLVWATVGDNVRDQH